MAPTSAMTGSQLYLRAAELLGERGWAQGVRHDVDGALCLRGAYKAAAVEAGVPDVLYWSTLQRWLVEHEDASTAVEWNDRPERSAEDVVLALKRCAADQS